MQAGISRRELAPKIGYELMGYGNRASTSTGIHDPIVVRALALQKDNSVLVICSIEICYLRPPDIRAIQTYVAAHSVLQAGNLLITTTHTHSAPAAHDDMAWETPFVETIGDTIIEAFDSLQPAAVGIGAGVLYGYSINRRWLDRPIDPAVSIIRVDTLDGHPLAVVGNYANHAVVLGYDNLLISGDWPGYAARLLEDQFDGGFIAIITQGGAGDINPLTETVRQHLNAGHAVTSIGNLATYYGDAHPVNAWNIEDRKGGTFIECETIALAYSAEVKRIWDHVAVRDNVPLWIENLHVDATLADDEPKPTLLPPVLQRFLPDMSQETVQLPVMVVGLGDTIISTQPGEVFSETSVALRKMCQQLGFRYGLLMSYANGSYGYLPPENAFAEGGYEVIWPLGLGISRHLQARIRSSIRDILLKRVGSARINAGQ